MAIQGRPPRTVSDHMSSLTRRVSKLERERSSGTQTVIVQDTGSTVGQTPTGGLANQVLTKNSPANYDYSWKTLDTGVFLSKTANLSDVANPEAAILYLLSFLPTIED